MKKILLSLVLFFFTFQLLVSQPCTKVFISEYVEGSANNKAIELYNPTNFSVDLSTYMLVRYSNGGTQPYQVSLAGGTIPAKGTYVVVLDKRDPNATGMDTMISPDLAAKADTFLCPIYNTNRMMYFNGNDAITLEQTNGVVLDIFGVVGQNPAFGNGIGSEGGWNDIDTCGYISGVYWWLAWTMNHTMTRKNVVTEGVMENPNFFNTSLEWDTLPNHTFSQLGQHTCDCASPQLMYPVTITVKDVEGTVIEGASVSINSIAFDITDIEGIASGELPNGTYTYNITKANYVDATGLFTVSGSATSISVALSPVEYPVTMIVTNSDGDAIEWANIFIDNVQVGVTNAQGAISFESVNGTYTYKVTAIDYNDFVGSFTIAGSASTVNVVLSSVLHPVIITVKGTDGIALFGANIFVNDVFFNVTDSQGIALGELASSIYTIKVTLPDYVDYQGSFTVSGDTSTVDIELHRVMYPVTFTVKSSNGAVIGLADVFVSDISFDITDIQGIASGELPNGTYTCKVTKSDYIDYTGLFTVAGSATTIQIVLIKVGIDHANASFITLYPNPVLNSLYIDNLVDIQRVVITNVLGNEIQIFDATYKKNLIINTLDLHSGIYFVNFHTNEGIVKSMKMIKN